LPTSSKIKRDSASKFAELVSDSWKKIGGKTVEETFKKFCIMRHLMTEETVTYGISNLDCRDLKTTLKYLQD
jgi:hypothetical protein